jgi:ABC-2 type transport system permease protein
VRLLWHQLRYEQLVFWRSREAAVFVFLFPLLLFALLTAVYNGEIQGRPAPWALLAGMLGYGAANTAFAGLAILLITRRELGILKRIRATPLPTTIYLFAVLGSIMLVFALQAVALFVLGHLLESTPWPHHVFSLALTLALGAVAFAGLGVAITGFIRSLEGSSAALNVIVLPTAFLSGSFGEREHYPTALRAIGDALPLKYLLDAINAVYLHGHELWDEPTAVAVLAAWGAFGILVAIRKFRWEPREG